jgi:hypothetical protein
MNRAIGISVHTGWEACVLVGGSIASPEIVANQVIEILGDSERFCFHIAAAMKRPAAENWIDRARRKAVVNPVGELQDLRVGVGMHFDVDPTREIVRS